MSITTTASSSASDMNWLSAFPRLATITDPAWLDAQRTAKVYTFPSGTTFRPGESEPEFMLLARGTVRVYERAENGREIVLYRVHTGEMCVLSVAILLYHAIFTVTVVSEEEVQVVSIPQATFESAMAESPAFRMAIMSTFSQRMSALMRLVDQVAFQRLDLRLACILGRLFNQGGIPRLTVTHQQLAQEIGTTREVTSRLLKEFERLGYIRLHRGSIELLSVQGLARLSDERLM